MNTENQELKDMMEKHDYHRKQWNKWMSIMVIFVCVGAALPPLLLLIIPFFIKANKHLKVVDALHKECFLKSLSETDNAGYAKLYQYMINQKTWLEK